MPQSISNYRAIALTAEAAIVSSTTDRGAPTPSLGHTRPDARRLLEVLLDSRIRKEENHSDLLRVACDPKHFLNNSNFLLNKGIVVEGSNSPKKSTSAPTLRSRPASISKQPPKLAPVCVVAVVPVGGLVVAGVDLAT